MQLLLFLFSNLFIIIIIFNKYNKQPFESRKNERSKRVMCSLDVVIFDSYFFAALPATLHLSVVVLIGAPFPSVHFITIQSHIDSGWLFLLSWLLLLCTVLACTLVLLANVAGKMRSPFIWWLLRVCLYIYIWTFLNCLVLWIMQLSRFTTAAIGGNYRGPS